MCQKVEKYANELSIIRVVQTMLDLQYSEDFILDYVVKKFNVSLEDSQKYFKKACEKMSV